MSPMRKLIPLFILASVVAGQAQAGKMVCWTDDKGQKACGDRVPPQYAKKEREILDSQGRVIKKEERQKSDAEIAAARAKEAAEIAEKERLERQTKYDRFLLQTYTSTKQIEQSRDSRLATLRGQATLSDKANADTEKTLKALQDRSAESAKKTNMAPDAGLAKQIKQFELALAEGKAARVQRDKDAAEITAKFNADIERFKKLRAKEVEIGSPAPEVVVPAAAAEAAVTAAPAAPAPAAVPAAAPAPAPAPAPK